MKTDTPILKDLVLVGGGHSHVAVLRNFGMNPIPGVRLTLICRDAHTPYSGMLPGLVAGHYDYDEAHIDLGPLARFAGARFYHDEVTGLDLANNKVHCKDRPDVPFDVLSINIGSTPHMETTEGAAEVAVPVKPINGFLDRWRRLHARLMRDDAPLKLGVVGGGAGGVEILLAIQHRLRTDLAAQGRNDGHISYHLFTHGTDVLPTHNARVRAKFREVLAARGVDVHLASPVERVAPGRVWSGGTEHALDEVLWVTNAGAAKWLADAGLEVDDHGFVAVDETLQSLSHPNVFAAGDIAGVAKHPRPKSGVFAVRQGKPLANNLRRALAGERLKPFRPQQHFLSLISTGDKYAVASRGGFYAAGKTLWRWKDWIDRRFMTKYNELPEMEQEKGPEVGKGLAGDDVIKEISAIAMRCGGCGAKVGASVLSRALADLRPVDRPDVLLGLDAPDDAAVVEVPPGKVMVHTVDYFRAFVDDPYVFGKVAANHALGDIFAMNAEPQTALAIATVPYGIESQVEEQLRQMMAGALEVFEECGCALIGGHTSEGAELAFGFALNGFADPDTVLRKAGMRPGDALILTKPLGTGTLFAADMRLKAKGRWIAAALEAMQRSNAIGAKVLFEHGAGAATDITGFGLLGHLVEMVKASEVDVELDLAAVPLLDGALACVEAGIFSSLQPQNVRLRRAVKDIETASKDPRFPLIFDPQTAGGLLASVPAENADACLAALRKDYPEAAIIGRVRPESEDLEPIAVTIGRGEDVARHDAPVPA